MKTPIAILGGLASFLLIAGSACSSSTGNDWTGVEGDGWGTPLGGTRTCRVYWEECHDDYTSCRQDCWVSAYDNPSFNCTGLCMDRGWCYSYSEYDEERCARYAYEFQPAPNPEAEASCERVKAWLVGCGADVSSLDCGRWATVASAEIVAWVDQVAASSCSAAPDAPKTEGKLGTELCATVDAACSYFECNANWQYAVDQSEGWFNEDAKAAARACADESGCSNIDDCLYAWTLTVWGAIVEGEPPRVTRSR